MGSVRISVVVPIEIEVQVLEEQYSEIEYVRRWLSDPRAIEEEGIDEATRDEYWRSSYQNQVKFQNAALRDPELRARFVSLLLHEHGLYPGHDEQGLERIRVSDSVFSDPPVCSDSIAEPIIRAAGVGDWIWNSEEDLTDLLEEVLEAEIRVGEPREVSVNIPD